MGAYLSSPITTKEVFEGEGGNIRYGGAGMQGNQRSVTASIVACVASPLNAAAATAGWRRTMEDAHLCELSVNNDPDCSMFGVFDGHGGAEVAKFCQKYMASEIAKLQEFSEGNVEQSLVRVFHKMDEMLRDNKYAAELEQLKTREDDEEEGAGDEQGGNGTMDALDLLKRVFQLKRFMGDGSSSGSGEGSKPMEDPDSEENMVQAGCTAVVAMRKGNELYVANAGDSRGVLCRDGKALALSEDHKPAQQTERDRIVAAGGFLSDIGGVTRVNGNLNLSRAVGDLKYKLNKELQPKDQIITAEPDVRRVTLTPGDRFLLLACDGVWDVMTNQQAIDFVSSKLDAGMTPTQASCALLDACLAADPKEARGIGCDNMTALIVELKRQ